MLNTKIIAGFPGIGKTYFTNAVDNEKRDILAANLRTLKVLDLDSSDFSWKNDAFPWNYIEAIKENVGKYDIIFVSTHQSLLTNLLKEKLDVVIVYPDKRLKAEFIKRYKDRNNSDSFIKFIDNKWDQFIDYIDNNYNNGHKKIRVSEFSYMAITNVIGGLFKGYTNLDNLGRLSNASIEDMLELVIFNTMVVGKGHVIKSISFNEKALSDSGLDVSEVLISVIQDLNNGVRDSLLSMKDGIEPLIDYVERIHTFNCRLVGYMCVGNFRPYDVNYILNNHSMDIQLQSRLLGFYTDINLLNDLTLLKVIKIEIEKREMLWGDKVWKQ